MTDKDRLRLRAESDRRQSAIQRAALRLRAAERELAGARDSEETGKLLKTVGDMRQLLDDARWRARIARLELVLAEIRSVAAGDEAIAGLIAACKRARLLAEEVRRALSHCWTSAE